MEDRPTDAWSPEAPDRFGFASTRWSRVLAMHASDASRETALEELCRTYWSPVYAFIRRLGHDQHTAQDLTQAFFTQLLERDSLLRADPLRGRFRAFLKTLVRHFLADQHEHERALKRGGATTFIGLDTSLAESWLAAPASHSSPDVAFEKEWALSLLQNVSDRLEREHLEKGKADLWQALRPFLGIGDQPPSYDQLSETTGLSVPALKVAVHRLRQRYRDELRAAIGDTVEDPAQIDQELRELLAALRS